MGNGMALWLLAAAAPATAKLTPSVKLEPEDSRYGLRYLIPRLSAAQTGDGQHAGVELCFILHGTSDDLDWRYVPMKSM
jgi:hypothetical protein